MAPVETSSRNTRQGFAGEGTSLSGSQKTRSPPGGNRQAESPAVSAHMQTSLSKRVPFQNSTQGEILCMKASRVSGDVLLRRVGRIMEQDPLLAPTAIMPNPVSSPIVAPPQGWEGGRAHGRRGTIHASLPGGAALWTPPRAGRVSGHMGAAERFTLAC